MKDIKQIIREELKKVVTEETSMIQKGTEGDCYKNVQDYLLDNDIPNAVIVHGVVTSRNGTLNHAWIETDDEVYDPTTGIKTDKETYYSKLNPKVEAKYTFEEAMKKRFSTGQFGPWTEMVNEELEELLGYKPIHVYEETENFFPLATNVSLVTEENDPETLAVIQKVADNLTIEPKMSYTKNHILANVDMELADDAFKRDTGYYIGRDDKGILNRRLKVRELIKTGELKYAPIVNILMGNYGQPILSFTDGRHRFAELRDAGVKTINLAIAPEAKKYIPLLQKNNIQEIVLDEINVLNEKNPIDYNENLLIDEISKIAKDENLPTPAKQIDSGSDAMIFETSDPNMLIRAELIEGDESADDMRESILANPDIQETGGVAKVYNIDSYRIGDEEYLISWKEKVNPNFEYVLWRKYGDDNAPHILYALHLYNLIYGVREQRQQQLDILKNTEETSKLYDAVMQGLPVTDLAPSSNMGVNNDGYIVAYDC